MPGLAIEHGGGYFGATANEALYPGPLADLIARGGESLRESHTLLSHGHAIDPGAIEICRRCPIRRKSCVSD